MKRKKAALSVLRYTGMVLLLLPLASVWGQGLPTKGAPLVISEFMASNRSILSTVVEGIEVFPDWIELHNPSRRSLNLAGYYLTDDPDNLSKWACPDVSLASGAYWLVFATGVQAEDHPQNWSYRDQQGAYHANFLLAKEGEYLALVGPDSQILHEFRNHPLSLDRPGYPTQYTDMSFGLSGGKTRYFYTPTPGGANTTGYAEVSRSPTFIKTDTLFTRDVTLAMDHPTPGAKIYITLDGTEPTQDDIPLQGSSQLSATAEVAARAYERNKAPSPVVTQTYIKVSPSVLGFNSNLPIFVVHTAGGNISANRFTQAHAVVIDVNEDGRTRLTGTPDYAGRGAIRVRGSSTSGQSKHQYAFETWDLYNSDKDVSLLGFPAESDWILYAPFRFDRALINNPLVYELSNQAGRYAVRTRFCEMYLHTGTNTVTGNDYAGLYVLMEKIKQGLERVDVEDLDPWDSTEPRIQGGYLLSIDRRSSDVGFRTARTNTFFNNLYPRDSAITTKQVGWIKSYLDRFEGALYGSRFADPDLGYAAYIDVDSFIDHYLLNWLPMNVDAFRLSGYLFKKREGKLELGPLWDFDRALESTDGRDNNPETWSGGGTDFLRYLWWSRFFEDPDFWQKLIDRWFDMRQNVFSLDNLYSTIDRLAEEVREAERRNTQRWPSSAPRFGGLDGEIDHMKDWLTRRALWIDSRFVAAPDIFYEPAPAPNTTQVTLTNPNPQSILYYTLDGTDPRTPGIAVSEADIVTLVSADGPKQVLVPTGPVDETWKSDRFFDVSGWQYEAGLPGGIGYERDSGYQNVLSLDLEDPMAGRQTSCLVRIPFYLKRAREQLNFLRLQVQYDDGFVAYLNGEEIARANFTGTPTWNSSASGSHEATRVEYFDVSAFIQGLERGTNMLAIHALNSSPDSSDFLIWAELIGSDMDPGQQSGISPTAMVYNGPITLNETTQLKARVLAFDNDYSPWSPLAETLISAGSVVDNLRITELMYHPVDPNAEFIELRNIGAEAINLQAVTFTSGIEFTFPNMRIAPQAYCLVVKDSTLFESTYGIDPATVAIAGQYKGRLSNSGERITLEDADGQIIHDFGYSDDWYPNTDGDGYSLTVRQPDQVDTHSLSDEAAWRPSTHPGGSPGYINQ